MKRLAAVLVLLGVFVIGLTATASWANPEEACEQWPNNKQCTTTTVPTETEPPTTTEPPPTTTDEEPPPPTTTEEKPPPPNNGGTTGGSEPPTTDLPLTGLDAGWIAVIGICLLITGGVLMFWGRPGGGPWRRST